MKHVTLFSLFLITAYAATAQCNGNRYKDEIFSSFTKTTVTYSVHSQQTNRDKMDIYTPNGDTETNRPVILLAHGGSFTDGSRDEPTIAKLCERFAKRGYVTASMSYRLAGNAFEMFQESSAYPVVIKAVSDGKAAVRYLKANASSLGIDSNKIIVGGNSAGAILMLHLAYIDSVEEVSNEPIIFNAMNANGGFEGNSGNDGPTSRVFAVVDWAGGIKDTTWMSPGNVPVVNLHGDPDGTVPYNCGQVLNGISQVNVCGPGIYNKRLNNVGINYWEKRYPNLGHQPWGANANNAIFFEADSITRDFLYDLLCTVSSINDPAQAAAAIQLYPNPANNVFTVQSPESIRSIRVLDHTGRMVKEFAAVNNNSLQITTEGLSRGIYYVQVMHTAGTQAVVKKLIVE